jgi:type II secretory pathway pseudopilin PulG
VIGGSAAVLLPPVLQRQREAARMEESRENLDRIGEAIEAYHRRHETPFAGAPGE